MTVIKIENLWKEYRLGVIGHGTLSQDLQSWLAKIRGKEDPNSKISSKIKKNDNQVDGNRFWALQDINLEVKQGEVLGIIGKNGAGKSTLLKILSRVTAPSKGNIKVKGRIASLLEVGTGFHPELTGGENVYLNGAILGMSKKEINDKFDEIVDFSGIETFINTPVKRYSSGMYVRLAFAVAAHLDPEILIIDEVLAVGDAEFQQKCLGKMGEVSKGGRTVLFVSHNMGAINRLCIRGVYLENGIIKNIGDVTTVINKYIHGVTDKANERNWSEDESPGNENVQMRHIKITNENNLVTDVIKINESIIVEILLETKKDYPILGIGIVIKNSQGETVIHSSSLVYDQLREVKKGRNIFKIEIPPQLLNVGTYYIDISSDIPYKEILFKIENVLSFNVISIQKNTSIYKPATWKGVLSPEVIKWNKL
jgi:lipopolysaccharide transport system ATP-binding protein